VQYSITLCRARVPTLCLLHMSFINYSLAICPQHTPTPTPTSTIRPTVPAYPSPYEEEKLFLIIQPKSSTTSLRSANHPHRACARTQSVPSIGQSSSLFSSLFACDAIPLLPRFWEFPVLPAHRSVIPPAHVVERGFSHFLARCYYGIMLLHCM
jgi:hypothetical protein